MLQKPTAISCNRLFTWNQELGFLNRNHHCLAKKMQIDLTWYTLLPQLFWKKRKQHLKLLPSVKETGTTFYYSFMLQQLISSPESCFNLFRYEEDAAKNLFHEEKSISSMLITDLTPHLFLLQSDVWQGNTRIVKKRRQEKMNDLPAIQRRRHSRGCKTEQFRETCRFHNRSSFEILSDGKNPKNSLVPPCSPDPPRFTSERETAGCERKKQGRHHGVEKNAVWRNKTQKGKEIEHDGNNGKENREQSSTAKQAHNQSRAPLVTVTVTVTGN